MKSNPSAQYACAMLASVVPLLTYHPVVARADEAPPANNGNQPAATQIPQVAQAQGAGSAGIEEIVVTANKRQELISKVGQSVQVLSAQALDQEHVTSLADLAAAVPGLTFTQSEYGTPVYTLRGVGFYDTSLASYPDVSVYLDQAPLPFPVQTELTLFDVERVEVLKGPQGTLFGNNATGGAINYIAKKPTEDYEAGADVSYGNYNTFQADGFVSGPIAPTLLARFAFNTIEGDGWQHSDAKPLSPGIVSDIQNGTGLPPGPRTGSAAWPGIDLTPNTQAGDVNGRQDKAAVRAIFDWTPIDDLHVEWDINGWHDGSQPQQPQLFRYKPGFGPGAGTSFLPANAPPAYYSWSPFNSEPIAPNDATVADWPGGALAPEADNSLYQSTLRIDYDLTDEIKLTSITNYVNYSRNERDDGDGSQWTDATTAQIRGYANTFSQELRVAGGGAGPNRWIGGVNYEYDNVYERDTSTYPQSPSARQYGNALDSFVKNLPVAPGVFLDINPFNYPDVGNSFDSRQNISNYAIFANDEYDIFDQLTLKGGVRYTQTNRSDDACATYYRGTSLDSGLVNGIPRSEVINFLTTLFDNAQARPDACFPLGPSTNPYDYRYLNRLDQDNVSWHGGVDWRPTDDITVYANISKGFKAGSFPTIPGESTASQEPVTQESVIDYEVGARAQFFDHHLAINGDLFYYDYTDKQLKGRLTDPVFGVLDALVNIPKSTVEGAELEVHARPMAGLDVGGQVTYLEAQITNFVGYNAAGVLSNYDHSQVPFTPKWSFTGNINYEQPINDRLIGFVGGQVNYRSSATAAIGSPLFYGMPSYATVDLQAGVETSDNQWRAFMWGKNVTNQFYLINVIEAEDAITRYVGMPATFGVTVSYRFATPASPSAAEAPLPPPPQPHPAPPVTAAEPQREFQVFFDFDKSNVTAAAASVIQAAAAAVKAGNVVHLTVTGHTDTVGTAAYNQGLSERRAAAVKAELVKDGIDGGEVTTVGVGKTGLLVPTGDGVREPQNRRAVIDFE